MTDDSSRPCDPSVGTAGEHHLPWGINWEEPRVIWDAQRRMIGAMDTPEAARLVVEAVNAGDLDARREVARLTGVVEHYRHRMEMTPSSRQHLLGEDADASIQPEAGFRRRYADPARRLRDALANALAATRLGGSAAEALTQAREALEAFDQETKQRLW